MSDFLKSLLDKNPGSQTGELIGAYLSGRDKKDNRARNVLLASLFFNAKEAAMQSKVTKQLEELERQKTFDTAKITNQYNLYDKLMTDDEAFKKDKNYFKIQSEAEFARLNPNYDLSTEDARKIRNQEIDEYEQELINIHNEKIKTGNIKKRLSKEEFMKPLEDYYIQQGKQIAAPKNISLVHKAFDFVRPGKRKQDLQNITRDQALRSNFAYLLDPTVIQGKASIDLYRDPNQFKYNKTEAASYIVQTYGDNDLSTNIINSIQDDSSESFTLNDLKGKVLTNKINENINVINNEIKLAQDKYDIKYARDNQIEIADIDKTNESYLKGQRIFVDMETGLGDPETNKARYLIQQLEEETNPQLRRVIQKQINELSTGTTDRIIISNVVQNLNNPLIMGAIQQQINNGDFTNIDDYINQSVSQSYDYIDKIIKAIPTD